MCSGGKFLFFCPVCSNSLHLVTNSDSVFYTGHIVDD